MSLTLFRSIRFNIFLFGLILAAAALGTFLPQAGEAPQRMQEFLGAHPLLGPALDRLALFDLYHAPWFIALLALMAFDVVVCKLKDAPPDEDLERPIAKGRSRAQRWGSYVAHIGIVVLLAGALLKALFGFEEMLPILEGGSKRMQNRPWEVHVDRFQVSYYPGTATPRLFASDVRVYDKTGTTHELEEGELLAEQRIRVNEPLSLPGAHGLGLVRLYQASWGATGMFKSATLALGRQTLEIPMRGKTRLPGTDIEVQANSLLPDFRVSDDNRAETASMELANPAVQVTFFKGGKPSAPLWLIEAYPKAVFVEDERGVLRQAPPPPFRLAAVDPVLFSGLQVAYDPGIPVLYLGFALFLSGLCAIFYWHPG